MITTILTVTHIFPAIFVSLPTILEHLPLTCQTLCELLKIYPFNPIYVSIITYLLPIPTGRLGRHDLGSYLLLTRQKSSDQLFVCKSLLVFIVFRLKLNLSPPLQKP